MGVNKSLDVNEVIAALLTDAHASYGVVFNTRSLRNTLNVCSRRYRSEGPGFLTKTLPRLGKHFDQVLAGTCRLNPASIGFATIRGTELPRFLGEFFKRIFHTDGSVLPDPDANCVAIVREITSCFYKYELPYDEVQEQQVIEAFKQAEKDLSEVPAKLAIMHLGWCDITTGRGLKEPSSSSLNQTFENVSLRDCASIVRKAKRLLAKLFSSFDPTDITPSHGPGAVATKQRLWDKFLWSNVSNRITNKYPFDAYFCASLGHVCDVHDSFDAIKETDHSARVILVPKDSRGPRLISCEPVDFQWIQQGLRRAIYRLVEEHPITRWNVFFTDQGPNRRGALLGSSTGRYATLDLKEASDRVHLGLVQLIFPEQVYTYMESCRTTSTVLPDGTVLPLQKFAPMGSALCFPIMALTIWALLTAGAPNADTRESILVYGDDVIVPTAYAESAMAILEEFGLKINRSKSCTKGLFRESCGMDAFNGVDVTPVRIRTVWNESPRPDVYTSWIAYANSFWDRRCYCTYEYIVSRLEAIYGPIPGEDLQLQCPSLRYSSAKPGDFKTRYNKHLQKREFKVLVVKSPSVTKEINGWSMLLRYFTESAKPSEIPDHNLVGRSDSFESEQPFSVSRYTKRGTSILVPRWR